VKDVVHYTEEDLIRADDIAAKAAKAYAEYLYAQKLYEGRCKDYLAALKMEIRAKEAEKISEAELDTRARSKKEWLEFRKEEMDILREAGAAKIKYDNALRRWETVRSILSTKREEMRRLG